MSQKTDNRDNQTEMDEATLAMRKFLKQLGVTTHQELENALLKAVSNGQIEGAASLPVTATLSIPEIDFSHQVQATLITPSKQH